MSVETLEQRLVETVHLVRIEQQQLVRHEKDIIAALVDALPPEFLGNVLAVRGLVNEILAGQLPAYAILDEREHLLGVVIAAVEEDRFLGNRRILALLCFYLSGVIDFSREAWAELVEQLRRQARRERCVEITAYAPEGEAVEVLTPHGFNADWVRLTLPVSAEPKPSQSTMKAKLLTLEEAAQHAVLIAESLRRSLPEDEAAHSIDAAMAEICTGQRQAWVLTDTKMGICGYLATIVESDPLLPRKQLRLCALDAIDNQMEFQHWHGALNDVMNYAREQGCSHMVALSCREPAIALADRLGFDTQWRKLTLEVESDV